MAKVVTELDIEMAKWQAKILAMKKDMADAKAQAKAAGQGLGDELFGDLKGSVADAVAGALAAGGIKGMLDKFDGISDLATQLNETAETVQKVGSVAALSGTSIESVAAAMLKLEKNLGDVENSKAAEVLESFGFSAEAIMGMPLDAKIATLADAFIQARENGSGLAEMQALLGKGSAELIPLLSAGGDALREAFADAPVLMEESVDELAALNDEIDLLIQQLETLGGKALATAANGLAYLGAVGTAAVGYATGNTLGNTEAVDDLTTIIAQRQADAQQKRIDRDVSRLTQARNTQQAQDNKAAADADEAAAKEAQKAADEAVKIEKDKQERISKLQESMERGRLALMSPEQRREALQAKLDSLVNEGVGWRAGARTAGDATAQVKELRAELEALGPNDAAFEPMLARLTEAQDLAKAIATEAEAIAREEARNEPKAKANRDRDARAPGAVAAALNTLFGRASGELVLVNEAQAQTRELRSANTVLREIKDALKNGKPNLFLDEVFQ